MGRRRLLLMLSRPLQLRAAPRLRKEAYDDQRHELVSGRKLSQDRRSRRGAAWQYRAAWRPEPFGRTRSCRSGSPRKPPSRSAFRYSRSCPWHHAVLLGVPGLHQPAREHLCGGGEGHPRLSAPLWVPAHPAGQRPWRQPAGRRTRDRVDGRSSRCGGQIPQLVECAKNLRQGAGDRPGGQPRVVDGKFSLDAASRGGAAEPAKAHSRLRPHAGVAPEGVRKLLGDGNFGGQYEKPDEDMLALWEIAVAETRELLEGPWS